MILKAINCSFLFDSQMSYETQGRIYTVLSWISKKFHVVFIVSTQHNEGMVI